MPSGLVEESATRCDAKVGVGVKELAWRERRRRASLRRGEDIIENMVVGSGLWAVDCGQWTVGSGGQLEGGAEGLDISTIEKQAHACAA